MTASELSREAGGDPDCCWREVDAERGGDSWCGGDTDCCWMPDTTTNKQTHFTAHTRRSGTIQVLPRVSRHQMTYHSHCPNCPNQHRESTFSIFICRALVKADIQMGLVWRCLYAADLLILLGDRSSPNDPLRHPSGLGDTPPHTPPLPEPSVLSMQHLHLCPPL